MLLLLFSITSKAKRFFYKFKVGATPMHNLLCGNQYYITLKYSSQINVKKLGIGKNIPSWFLPKDFFNPAVLQTINY